MTRRYLTNMSNWQRPIVEEAIGLTSHCDIGIDDEPMPADALNFNRDKGYWYRENRHKMIGEYFSIYKEVSEPYGADASDFWDMYSRVYHSEKWQTWIALCKDDEF